MFYLVPPIHLPPTFRLQLRPLEYNPLSLRFSCFSSRHPRELENMKFLLLLCVVTNSGFEKAVSDHVHAQTSNISQSSIRYRKSIGQVNQSGTECALNLSPIPTRYINYPLLHDKSSQKFFSLKLPICYLFFWVGHLYRAPPGFSRVSLKTTINVSSQHKVLQVGSASNFARGCWQDSEAAQSSRLLW